MNINEFRDEIHDHIASNGISGVQVGCRYKDDFYGICLSTGNGDEIHRSAWSWRKSNNMTAYERVKFKSAMIDVARELLVQCEHA